MHLDFTRLKFGLQLQLVWIVAVKYIMQTEVLPRK